MLIHPGRVGRLGQAIRTGLPLALDLTGAAVRDAMADATKYGFSSHTLVRTDVNNWLNAGSHYTVSGTAGSWTLTKVDALSGRNIAATTAAPASSLIAVRVRLRAGTFSSVQIGSLASIWGSVAATIISGPGATSGVGTLVSVTGLQAGTATDVVVYYRDPDASPLVYLYPGTNAVGGMGNTLIVEDIVAAVVTDTSKIPAFFSNVAASVGSTTPGFLLPGTSGARINASARSSSALQIKADGSYEFSAENRAENSQLNGMVAGTPGTVPTSWTYSASTGTINAVTTDAAGNAILSATVAAARTIFVQSPTLEVNTTYTLSVVVLSNPDGMQLRNLVFISNEPAGSTLTYWNNGSSVANTHIPVAGDVIEVRIAVAGTGGTAQMRIGVGTSTNQTGTASISRPQINIGAGRIAYIPTPTAAVYGPAIDWLAAQSLYGVRSEPAATNRALWSRDLTNAAWVKSNATPVLTATGITSAVNVASTLTATAANATALQSITHASIERTLSIFLRRRTGTGTVETTINNGTTWVARTLTASWQRFTTTLTVANPIIGVRIVTSGDAIDVDVAQVEDGAVATSPIITAGATATRAVDDPIVPYTLGSAATLAVDYVPLSTGATTVISANDTTVNERVLVTHDGVLAVTDGGASQATPDAGTPTSGLNRYAASVAANSFRASLNGAAVASDTSGTMPTATRIQLGAGSGVTITRLRARTAESTDAVLQGLTA